MKPSRVAARPRLSDKAASIAIQFQRNMTKDAELQSSPRKVRLSPSGSRRASFRASGGVRLGAPWPVWAAGAGAALTLIGTLLLLSGLVAPQGAAGAWSPAAGVHDLRATALLEAGRMRPAELAAARRETLAALARSPVDDAAWLRMAYIDRLRGGRLAAEGKEALRRSYDVAPYGPDTSLWRVRFALENWQDLDPELRRETLDEVRVQWDRRRRAYEEIAAAVQDPAGRMALLLVLDEAKRRATSG